MVAAPSYTVDGLVASVRNKYITPASQNLFQDADIVGLLDEEMRETIVPLILSAREDFWTLNYDQAISGAAAYTIPPRACGGILRDVVFVDTQGNEIEMTRLSPAQIKSTFPFGYQLPLYTFGFYLKHDQLLPYPQQAINATAYTLRMKIFRRPNNLTLSANCGQITNIVGNVITLSSFDTTWTTSTKFDIIQPTPPMFTSLQDDSVITALSSANSTITLQTVPAALAVGMWVCPQYMTCVPQIIYDAFPLLVRRGVCALASSLGDSQGAERAEKDYERTIPKFLGVIQPRVQGTAKKVVNRNSPYSWGTMGTGFVR